MRKKDFSLRFDQNQIEALSARYAYKQGDKEGDAPPKTIGSRAKENGFLTKPDFLKLCKWKTPRSQKRCEENGEEMVKEATRVAFSTPVEVLRIGVLTLLRGVSWPTASAILHFCHRDHYPLLDYRALWSLGTEDPKHYTFDLWSSYTQCCRELAQHAGVPMRTLDRALWQYSKENQP